ncbi:MAG: LON peptidase substrate-binding domain-containing protein, partial [Ktedonobacteraceae bacterium]
MSEQERIDTCQETQEADVGYPLVALKSMVVFPRTRMTLAIARDKSMRAVEEAMMQPHHWLVVASQRDPDIDDPEQKDIYVVGTLVEITTMHHQTDGSLQVL